MPQSKRRQAGPAEAARPATAGAELLEVLGRSPDAVLLLDVDAVVLDANEASCRSLGYAQAELTGKHVREFVEGLDGAPLADVTRLLRDRGVATFRAFHRRRDGTRFPVETHLALLRRPDRVLVVAFSRDLTEQEAAHDALRESEGRYARLVELLPDGVVTYDAEGRLTFANAAAARLAGVARVEDVLGQSVLEHVHPSSHAAVLEGIARVSRGERVWLEGEQLVRADGTAYPVELAAGPLGEGEGIVVVRDASERRRAEAERTAFRDRLVETEKLQALGTLAGGVAHDFNNALATILGHADVLASDLPPADPRRHDAEQIAAAARRARGVVQQLLSFARPEPGDAAPLDVAAAVREELVLLRPFLPAALELAPRLDPAAGAIRAEPAQLHQLLLDLCTNARDAMEGKAGVVGIAVDAAELPGAPEAPAGLAPGRYVRVSVTDAGCGMDEATRARAFEPYFTTKRSSGAAGLGLSVVHGIAVALGGAVALDSGPGRGTRVDVWLPRVAAAAAAPSPTPTPAELRRRILLVDDDPPVARAIGRMLERLGYEVTTSGNGADALALFRRDPSAFDAVLTDETLPGLRGDQLTRELLLLRPELPVLICTGYSEHVDEESAREIGARGLLMKPLDVAQLAEAVRAAIAGG